MMRLEKLQTWSHISIVRRYGHVRRCGFVVSVLVCFGSLPATLIFPSDLVRITRNRGATTNTSTARKDRIQATIQSDCLHTFWLHILDALISLSSVLRSAIL